VSNSLDLDETLSTSKLFAYGNLVMIGGLRVNDNDDVYFTALYILNDSQNN